MSDKQLSFLQLLNASHLNTTAAAVSTSAPLLHAPQAHPAPHAPQAPQSPPLLPPLLAATSSRRLAEFLPTFLDLKRQIISDALSALVTLPQLNSSRRKQVLQYFSEISPGLITESALQNLLADDQKALKDWVLNPKSDSQRQTLEALAEDLALLWLGSTLVLKSWSDRGIRPMDAKDLAQVNWALSAALKPHLPLDREPWQITRQNIFSWFNPTPESQRITWNAIQELELANEGPQFVAQIIQLRRLKPAITPSITPSGYDPRWFQAFWKAQAAHGFDFSRDFRQGMITRKWRLFSPTLGSGALDIAAPSTVDLLGVESATYSMMSAELTRLWWGPATPPLWAVGSGLDLVRTAQLDIAWNSVRSSTQDRLTDMESVDIAVVIEGPSQRQIKLPENNSALKAVRTSTTTLGALHALVAISKLKPGGLLWWFREEALGPHEGSAILKALFDKGALLQEVDLSGLEHSLPSLERLFPKFVYCFRRELDVECLKVHRPRLFQIQGSLRSHVELPLLHQTVFEPMLGTAPTPTTATPPGAATWAVHVRTSPSSQSDWIEHWPNAASQKALMSLEALRDRSEPLGQLTMIRNLQTHQVQDVDAIGTNFHDRQKKLANAICGFVVKSVDSVLRTFPLSQEDPHWTDGFLVACSDPRWVAPLATYLESPWIALWLEHFGEHKRGKLVLKESTLKFLPVPKALIQVLQSPPAANPTAEWIRLATQSAYQPDLAREELATSSLDPVSRNGLFVETATTLKDLETSQARLLELMANGRIRWRKVVELLPEREVMPFPMHTEFRISGNLPPNVPISKWNRVKHPVPGVNLLTEAGFQASITLQSSQSPEALMDILVDQISELSHPTWSELVQFLRVPRQMDYARAFADDILRSHEDQDRRLKSLRTLLNDCLSL